MLVGKNFARKLVEHSAHVVFFSLLAKNHCFAFPKSENGKRHSNIATLKTSLIVKVLEISKKC